MKKYLVIILAFIVLLLSCFGVSGATYKFASDNVKEIIKEVEIEVPVYPDENSKMTLKEGEYYFTNFKNKLYYYNQNDYYNIPYSIYGTIKSHGCGPTVMAMVLSSYKNEKILPQETVKYACDNDYCTLHGTDLAFFESIGKEYGLKVEGPLDASNKDNQIKALESLMSDNKLVIIRAYHGYFYGGSHYMLLAGNVDGKILVLDPNSRKKTGTYSFDYLMSDRVGTRYIFIISEEE